MDIIMMIFWIFIFLLHRKNALAVQECALSSESHNVTVTYNAPSSVVGWRRDTKPLFVVSIAGTSSCTPPVDNDKYTTYCEESGLKYTLAIKKPCENNLVQYDSGFGTDSVTIVCLDPQLPVISFKIIKHEITLRSDVGCVQPKPTITLKYRTKGIAVDIPGNPTSSSDGSDCTPGKVNATSSITIDANALKNDDRESTIDIISEISYENCSYTGSISNISITLPSNAAVCICTHPYSLPTLIICVVFIVVACICSIAHFAMDQKVEKTIIDVCLVLSCLGCAATSIIQIPYVAGLINTCKDYCDADGHYASIVFICIGLVCTIGTVCIVLKRRVCNTQEKAV